MGHDAAWVVIQHVAHEGPGSVAQAVARSGRALQVVRVHAGDPVPAADAVSDMAGLVVLGGPMSVHDDLPWLAEERALVRAAAATGLPVLGICLGAQQLALALGGEVRRGPAPEWGVGEVHLTAAAVGDAVFGAAPSPLPCVHWHGDTFSLPPGAVHLARSDAYENQAFRVGPRSYGLQFHVEVTAALAGHWGPHLPPGVFIRASDVAHVARAGDGIVRRMVALAERDS
jgi:GMP synthase-like glutamine amidotransferase